MIHRIYTLSLIVFIIIYFVGCGQTNYHDTSHVNFPTAGEPSGDDVFSSSTNRSDKEGETAPQLNAYAGAAFIAPPQINNYGTVNLSCAIEIPSGRAGLQPAVGLSYTSSGGDGLVGIGWNLSTGLGTISRATQHGELYYDYRDTFTYNGKRLVKVSGPARSENGTYRAEIESDFSRFELSDAESGGVWRVYDKSGRVTVFGGTRASRIWHPHYPAKTFTWQFDRITDLNGNYMSAEYDGDTYSANHMVYLKEIRYTGNTETELSANQYVRFNYKSRSEAYVSKTPGFILRMDKLLDSIEVGWYNPQSLFGGGTALWRYTMVYELSEDSNRQVLKTVKSDRNTTQPEFIYQKAEHELVWRTIANPDSNDLVDNPASVQYFEGDFNGDGISDMVFFNPATGKWKAAEGQRDEGYSFKVYGEKFKGYNSPEKIRFFRGNATGDYNGDGRSDIALYLPATKEFWVAEHDGNIFQFTNYGKLSINIDIFSCEWFPGDYDGNGLSDVVLFNEPTGEWIFMKNAFRKFEFITFSYHFQNAFRDDYNPDADRNCLYTADISLAGGARDRVQFLSGDFNGDGRTDIGVYDARDGNWWVGENYKVESGKVNGESSFRFELQWKLYSVFNAPAQALFSNDRFSGDFNGDGFSDVLIFDRDSGTWVLGETGDGFIDFINWSETPQYKDITRWLQGDFNGDGRTDIGFFLKSDNRFWIGEATPDGFRYRIYSDLAYGPDPDRVLAAPYPEDEIIMGTGRAVAVGANSTATSEYEYDTNYHTGRGEMVFYGNFSGDGVPELLIFRRHGESKGFYSQKANGSLKRETGLDTIDLNDQNIHVLNNGRALSTSPLANKDGVLFYRVEQDGICSFYIIQKANSNFTARKIALINNDIKNFNPDESLYLYDDFNSDGSKELMVLNDQTSGDASFYTFNNDGSININPYAVSVEGGDLFSFKNIFSDNGSDEDRNQRGRFAFFSGNLTGRACADILMVDTRDETHPWYIGTVDAMFRAITFKKLDASPYLHCRGKPNSMRYAVHAGVLTYSSNENGSLQFYTVSVGAENNFVVQKKFVPQGDLYFHDDFDHLGRPVVQTSAGLRAVVFGAGGGCSLTPLTNEGGFIAYAAIKREDLRDEYYPFSWTQGDFNGDGKTDIGFFHLKERSWYFAVTRGTVPDMLTSVNNGIGGTYAMEYINSTSLDNTGTDGIPHLPMNYKVCASLRIDDGIGNWTKNIYSYSGGYAYSDFLNGYKETDYFGFGTFSVRDRLNNTSTSTYHNVPCKYFLDNRALAGAIKESRFTGPDGTEYSKTTYRYKLHQIKPDNAPSSNTSSYVVEPVEIKKYMKGTLTETRTSLTDLGPETAAFSKQDIEKAVSRSYEMKSKTESSTDHYEDTVHSPVQVSSFSAYDNDPLTNEMRLVLKKNFAGTAHETTELYTYDSRGNMTQSIRRYTGTGLAPVSDVIMGYRYDDYGNCTREINLSGSPSRETIWLFDTKLHQYMTEERNPGDAVTLITKYAINYASAFGAVERKEDPNGKSTYFEFDQYGRLARQYADTDSGKELFAEYAYDASFPLSAKVLQYTRTGDAIATRIFADGTARTIHTLHSALNEPGKRYTKTGLQVYDQAGRTIRTSQTHWAADDEINGAYHANKREKYPTVTAYEPGGRIQKMTFPPAYASENEASITYTYNDPWEVTETNSIGRSKRTVRNSRGLVLYVEDSGTGDDNMKVSAAIGFAYDIAGRRVKKMDLPGMSIDVPSHPFTTKDDSGKNIAYWWYDGFGRLSAANDPDLGYSEITYTPFSETASTLDSLNRVTTMTYDRLGRIIEKHLPDDEGSTLYTYDTLPGSEHALGRLVSVKDPAQTKTFSYNPLGRVSRETRRLSAEGPGGSLYTTDFTYDLLGRKKKIIYPLDPASGDRMTVTYSHNPMGVVSITGTTRGTPSPIVAGISYNEFGQMTKISRGNGVATDYHYDIRGRLTRLVSSTASGGTSYNIQDMSYSFKTDDSIAGIENRPDFDVDGAYASTIQYSYRYDGLNRLINATGSYEKVASEKVKVESLGETGKGGEAMGLNGFNTNVPISGEAGMVSKKFEYSFGYAPNGNIINKIMYNPDTREVEDAWGYEYQNHAVTGIVSTKFGGTRRFSMHHDPVGNMTGQHDRALNLHKEMEYDSMNRITRVIDPDTGDIAGDYAYDDQGFRVRKISRQTVKGEERSVEILYPSMFFGLEKQKDCRGKDVPNTACAVNNIYLNGVRIAAVGSNRETRYYLTDQIDSVKVVVDGKGKVLTRLEYLPYGETWFSEGDESNKPKFGSQELDEETGYYYFNARYFEPQLGRFVTGDNVIDDELSTQGWNRYSYVKNNPIMYKDPTGHVVETFWDVISAGIGLGQLGYDIIKYARGTGSKSDVATSAVAVGLDIAAALIPFVPGGASVAMKTSRTAIGLGKEVQWTAKAVKNTDKIITGAKIANESYRGYEHDGVEGAAKGGFLEIFGKFTGKGAFSAITSTSESHIAKKIGTHITAEDLEHAEMLINKVAKTATKKTLGKILDNKNVANSKNCNSNSKVEFDSWDIIGSMGI